MPGVVFFFFSDIRASRTTALTRLVAEIDASTPVATGQVGLEHLALEHGMQVDARIQHLFGQKEEAKLFVSVMSRKK
jgi:hypothetical protein